MICDLKCFGCYAWQYSKKNDLPHDVCDRIIEEANAIGIYFFVITGGEPFMWDYLFEFLEKHNDSFFQIYTNGQHIDEEVAKKLAKLGNAVPCISLEGFKDATDARRGEGAWDRIMNAYDVLRKHGVIYGFSITATSKNNELIELSRMPKAGKPCFDSYYLRGLKEGWFALTNTLLKLGIGFCFELDVFPYITYWQACNGNLGYPWYGRTYNISVELWNSYTDRIRTAKANGTIRHIAAGETIATSFKAIVYTGLESVKQISFDEEVK